MKEDVVKDTNKNSDTVMDKCDSDLKNTNDQVDTSKASPPSGDCKEFGSDGNEKKGCLANTYVFTCTSCFVILDAKVHFGDRRAQKSKMLIFACTYNTFEGLEITR